MKANWFFLSLHHHPLRLPFWGGGSRNVVGLRTLHVRGWSDPMIIQMIMSNIPRPNLPGYRYQVGQNTRFLMRLKLEISGFRLADITVPLRLQIMFSKIIIAATLATTAMAYCPNGCSGHGTCQTNPKVSLPLLHTRQAPPQFRRSKLFQKV